MNYNNSRNRILEKNKKSTKTKTRSKYRNKLNISANPFFPKEKEVGIELDTKKEYTYEYLKLFENLQISKNTDLLTEEVLNHITEMEDNMRAMKMDNLLVINSNTNNSSCNTSKSSCSSISNKISLEPWGRPDYTKETEEAENNKKKFEEIGKKDIIKKELRELLNKMTKDNYEEIKSKILEIIKDKIENQDKLIDIIFLKSLLEKSYVSLYAKLCKDLNKELPQKVDNDKNKKRVKKSLFREKLLDKCKEMVKYEEKNIFDEYIKEENEEERELKIKKIILGNALFITELINIKLLAKRAACDCINYLFKKYDEGKDNKLKLLNIQTIIIFIDKFGSLIQNEKENKKEKNKKEKDSNINFEEKIKETFDKLEKIKEDKNIPGHIKYSIINLIIKKENNYKQSEFEKYLIAKSKKEIEEETKEIKEEKEKEINQEDINKLIEKDLIEYKDIIETEGNSDKYSWNITTDLYDLKLKGFDSILEGYFISSADFIENKENIKYAKNYIKELIEYYHEKMEETEKNHLLKKIIDLFELVKDFSYETPDIYMIYEYVLQLFIENEIIKIKDFENIFEAKEKEDINIISNMFQNIFRNINKDKYENEFRNLKYIKVQVD